MNKKYKDILNIATCGLSFLFGWGLTIAGFIVPPTGEVSGSVLWILGQALLYCGACIGISEHYSSKLHDFQQEIRKEIKK